MTVQQLPEFRGPAELRRRGGAAHDHTTFVAGCFRCDLARDELGPLAPADELTAVLGPPIGQPLARRRSV